MSGFINEHGQSPPAALAAFAGNSELCQQSISVTISFAIIGVVQPKGAELKSASLIRTQGSAQLVPEIVENSIIERTAEAASTMQEPTDICQAARGASGATPKAAKQRRE